MCIRDRCLNAGMIDPASSPAVRPYLHHVPTLGARAYVDPAAIVIGDVVLGEDVSVWPMTVIRGDVNFVRIGDRTNIQDGTCLFYTSRCV